MSKQKGNRKEQTHQGRTRRERGGKAKGQICREREKGLMWAKYEQKETARVV